MHARLYIWGAAAALLTSAALLFAPRASAQSLVEMYRSARFRVQAHELLEIHGRRARPLPVEPLPYVTDSVRRHMAVVFPPAEPDPAVVEEPRVRIRKTSLTPKLGRSWFESEFADARWSYLGSNELIAVDTTFTRELRAMMEDYFGSPTRTIADDAGGPDDADRKASDEYIQFEYWFVLNDSIPLIVMDVNGPFERGVVVASDQEYRALLPELKEALLAPVIQAGRRAPYVDYYYLKEQQIWFLTGFDGERYFLERIRRPDLKLGRPLLETVLNR